MIETLKKTIREQLAATVAPSTFDVDNNTVDVAWYTGATVLRGGFFTDPYELRFDMGNDAADLSRLNDGAAVLADHHASLASQIGAVVPGSARIEDGLGLASIRFSSRPEFAGIVADIKAGIISKLSMGADIHERTITEREGDHSLHVATSWSPVELSFVPVPADAATTTLSDDTVANETLEAAPAAETLTADAVESAPIEAPESVMSTDQLSAAIETAKSDERARLSGIEAAAAKLGLDLSHDVVVAAKAGDVSVADAREQLWAAKVAGDAAEVRGSHTAKVSLTKDAHDDVLRGASEALTHRMSTSRDELSEVGRVYRNKSMIELGRDLLRPAMGNRADRLTRTEVARELLGGHTPSDFPNLLSTSANKVLIDAYNEQPQAWRAFAMEMDLKDYKTHDFDRLGEVPGLEDVPAGGEYKEVALSEQKETVTAIKRGNIVSLTREAIINDDLNAFANILRMQGAASSRKETSRIANIFTANSGSGQTMGDTNNLFDSSNHGNLVGSGGVPGVAQLQSMRALFGAQTGVEARRASSSRWGSSSPRTRCSTNSRACSRRGTFRRRQPARSARHCKACRSSPIRSSTPRARSFTTASPAALGAASPTATSTATAARSSRRSSTR